MSQRDLLKGARITVTRMIEETHPEGSAKRQETLALINSLFDQRMKELDEREATSPETLPPQ